MLNHLSQSKKRESRSKFVPAVGRCVSVRTAAGACLFHSKNHRPLSSLRLPRFRLSEFWSVTKRGGLVRGVTTRSRERWRGEDISRSSSISGRRRLPQLRRCRSFVSVTRSFFSFAVDGSTFREVKVYSTLCRRLMAPSLLGFSFISCLFLVLRFGSWIWFSSEEVEALRRFG